MHAGVAVRLLGVPTAAMALVRMDPFEPPQRGWRRVAEQRRRLWSPVAILILIHAPPHLLLTCS